ncbi:MAG: START domain-containing protein [Bacteroidota bacterium]
MRYVLFFFLLVFSNQLLAQTNWKKAYDEEDVLIYTRTTKEGLFEFKASTTYNYAVEKVLAAIRDFKSYPEWSYKTKEFRLLERLSEDEHYAYSVVDFPFPMKDRDLVMLSKTSYLSDKSIFIQMESVADKMEETDYVRMEGIKGFWKLIPLSDKKTKVVYQIASDPNGMPNWLIELFALEAPKGNLKGLKKIVARKK